LNDLSINHSNKFFNHQNRAALYENLKSAVFLLYFKQDLDKLLNGKNERHRAPQSAWPGNRIRLNFKKHK